MVDSIVAKNWMLANPVIGHLLLCTAAALFWLNRLKSNGLSQQNIPLFIFLDVFFIDIFNVYKIIWG
jgi:hypothetical protein